MDPHSQPPDGSVPPFLGRGTAALLTALPAGEPGREDGSPPPGREQAETALDDRARRLWEELARRLEAGETRLYAEDLATLAIPPQDGGAVFQALRQAGLVDWDDPGPYLYLRRPPAGATGSPPAAVPVASGPPGVREDELRKVYQAIEWACGGQWINPLESDRIKEWLSVLGLREMQDVIGLCRERGPCRYKDLARALDKAVRQLRHVSPFGPLNGHGVVPSPDADGQEAGLTGPEPVANATAYEPVPPGVVESWVKAHSLLYADAPPPPPREVPPDRPQATRAGAYDPVPAEVVRTWVEAFPGEYERYRREYHRLIERSKGGPFARRKPGTR